jgi:hypothetical protein
VPQRKWLRGKTDIKPHNKGQIQSFHLPRRSLKQNLFDANQKLTQPKSQRHLHGSTNTKQFLNFFSSEYIKISLPIKMKPPNS